MGVLQDIIELYGKGGIEVITFASTSEVTADPVPLIRTVIQPNASLITWIQPGSEAESTLEKHHENLQNYLRSLRDFRRRLRAGAWIATLVSLSVFFWYSAQGDFSPIVRLAIMAVAAVLFGFLFRYVIPAIFRWYIRKKLQKYFSPSPG